MDKREAFRIAYRQLALEFGCTPEAFSQPGLTLTTAAFRPGARGTIRKDPMLLMAGTGNSVVIAANGGLRELVEELAGNVNGLHRLFEYPALKALDAKLSESGRTLWGTEHFFLPGNSLRELALPGELQYRWFDAETVQELYPNECFRMALAAEHDPARPDMIALAALDGGKIAGVAGASADTETMWQVGIDVVEGYRGKGLGAALVSALSREIENRGKLPFYGTAVGNLDSQRIAIQCGFVPAWIETDA